MIVRVDLEYPDAGVDSLVAQLALVVAQSAGVGVVLAAHLTSEMTCFVIDFGVSNLFSYLTDEHRLNPLCMANSEVLARETPHWLHSVLSSKADVDLRARFDLTEAIIGNIKAELNKKCKQTSSRT